MILAAGAFCAWLGCVVIAASGCIFVESIQFLKNKITFHYLHASLYRPQAYNVSIKYGVTILLIAGSVILRCTQDDIRAFLIRSLWMSYCGILKQPVPLRIVYLYKTTISPPYHNPVVGHFSTQPAQSLAYARLYRL
jgi:hypothetical protein